MKYILLPILDRRVITPRNTNSLFYSVDWKDNFLLKFYNEKGIKINKVVNIWQWNGITYLIGYCTSVKWKVNADLHREEILTKTLPTKVQNNIREFVKNDKINSMFKYLENNPTHLTTLQTFTFINIKWTNKVCLVRDWDEEHYSLPWWTCELYENDIEWARREVIEEAQIGIDKTIFLWWNHVDIHKDWSIVQSFFQSRFLTYIDESYINEFIPFKDWFETIERIFVNVQDLPKYIKRLDKKNWVFIYSLVLKYIQDRKWIQFQ